MGGALDVVEDGGSSNEMMVPTGEETPEGRILCGVPWYALRKEKYLKTRGPILV
jgi:hypothetical protein